MSLFRKKIKPKEEVTAPAPSVPELPPDISEAAFVEYYDLCRRYTMTSVERMYALYKATRYVLDNNIAGDFVECGVWKGGSAMLMAKMFERDNITDRKIILYDTYEGMPEPTQVDKDFTGTDASVLLQSSSIEDQSSVWCYSSLEEVRTNLLQSKLSNEQLVMIKGKVEETIPEQLPTQKIALLRLDTDWYESTLHELIHLYPLLASNGVLIIDDYGHWQGCRRAVDEYFSSNNINILLNRIDGTGRIALKNL